MPLAAPSAGLTVLTAASRQGPPGAPQTARPVALRVAIFGVAGIIVISVLLLRLWALTVLSGTRYAELAQDNQVRRIPVEAPRGMVIDRAGHPLVLNRADRVVVLTISDIPDTRAGRRELYVRLSSLLDVPVGKIARAVGKGEKSPLLPVVIADDIQDSRVIYYLEEHYREFPGVSVRQRYARDYVNNAVAAHLLGQVGEVTAPQLKGEFMSLRSGDRVGQTGLERTYDSYLRGSDGYNALEVDASGAPQGIGRGAPSIPGNNLRLSIDLGLQRATEDALRQAVATVRRKGHKKAGAGAVVALDPRNGEVLAMASYPDYDPNMFVTRGHDKEIAQLFHDSRNPMQNRAISGLYPPGSTFKPVTALAAMGQRFITSETMLPCPSSLDIAGTKFHNWFKENLGAMNVSGALEVSCDTFFYQLSLDFYNTPGSKLQDWSRKFGLGQQSGIDLPGESDGLVPTPKWRRETFTGFDREWSPGHSVNLSIGQGDLLTTPLQMTMVYGAIANGGTLYTPRIARSVEDAAGKTLVTFPGAESMHIPVSDVMLKAVRDGLYGATHGVSGTSTQVFGAFPIPVSGKTGTAEKPPAGNMAWFCGYAPADAPTIVACSLVEDGGHGGESAAPILLRMFEQYFNVRGGVALTGQKSD